MVKKLEVISSSQKFISPTQYRLPFVYIFLPNFSQVYMKYLCKDKLFKKLFKRIHFQSVILEMTSLLDAHQKQELN